MEKVILIAGNDRDDQLMLQHAFTEKGYSETLIFVDNGVDFLKYLSLQKPGSPGFPSTVIIGLDMPGMNGRDTLKRLKQDPSLRAVPVIVMTATNSKAEAGRCYGLGAHGYIVRPLTPAEFLSVAGYIRSYCYRM